MLLLLTTMVDTIVTMMMMMMMMSWYLRQVNEVASLQFFAPVTSPLWSSSLSALPHMCMLTIDIHK